MPMHIMKRINQALRLVSTPSVVYAGGSGIFAVARFLRDVIVAGIVGPVGMGLWGSLNIYRQFAAFSDLGALNGLNRLLPHLVAKNEITTARRLMALAWWAAMLLSVISSLFLVMALFDTVKGAGWFLGAVTLILLLFIEKQYKYCAVVCYAYRQVAVVGVAMGLWGVIELVLAITLSLKFGLAGFYAAMIIGLAVATAVLWSRQPLRAATTPDLSLGPELSRISATLLAFGLFSVAAAGVDRMSIVITIGAGSVLGLYHTANAVASGAALLPLTVQALINPVLSRCGEDDHALIRPFLGQPFLVVVSSAVVTAGVIAIVTIFLFNTYLLKFKAALDIIPVLLLTQVLLAAAGYLDAVAVVAGVGPRVLKWKILLLLLCAGGMIGGLHLRPSLYFVSILMLILAMALAIVSAIAICGKISADLRSIMRRLTVYSLYCLPALLLPVVHRFQIPPYWMILGITIAVIPLLYPLQVVIQFFRERHTGPLLY